MSTSLIKTQASKGIAGMALLGRVLIKNTSRVAAGRAAFMRMYSARPASAAESARETTERPKVTIHTIKKMYGEGKPLAMMTAYDYPTAVACERAGMDIALVGDSLAMVALGHEDTSQVTMDEMLHHSRAVARGLRTCFLVADLPFGAYHADEATAVSNAIRMVKEGRAEAVKLEAGRRMAPRIEAIVHGAGIPVIGHIGLTPQTAVALGGFRVQGKSVAAAQTLIDDALALQNAGCFALLLEAMPAVVAETITKLVSVPTIGIGAGAGTSGQVLVLSDMLGMFDRFTPKFCRRFADLAPQMHGALHEYRDAVRTRQFPEPGVHTYAMPPAAEESWRRHVRSAYGFELESAPSATKQQQPGKSASAAATLSSA